MSRTIPYSEYRRRVFNTALLEAIKKPYFEALGLTESLTGGPVGPGPGALTTVPTAKPKLPGIVCSDGAGTNTRNPSGVPNGPTLGGELKSLAAKVLERKRSAAKNEAADQSAPAAPQETDGSPKKPKKDEKPLNSCGDMDPALCESMCNSYFTEELGLNEATVDKTIARLQDANYYIVEACEECKEIADRHAEEAKEAGTAIQDDEKIELSPEDNEVLDQLFHTKGPGPQVDQIRDATVKALLAEKKKSEEVRDALDLAQSKVTSGEPNAYNETAARLSKVGPTSLMGSIMNHMGRAAVNEVNEAGNFVSVGDVLAENADTIKTRSVALYAIMETGNQLEITHMTNKDVERLANNIFYQK